MLLTEKSRMVDVTAQAQKDEFVYDVNYRFEGNTLQRLCCDVKRTVEQSDKPFEGAQNMGQEMYLGYMINESGNKQICLPEDMDIAPHLSMFEEILCEVKDALAIKVK